VPAGVRDELRASLRDQGIGNEVYYPVPLHRQECYADLGYDAGALPHAEAAAEQTIALPVYPELTEEQRLHVVQTVTAFVSQSASVTT